MDNNGETSEVKSGFNIPVLFLTFNRLDTTKQVFEVIRKASPRKLYLASDGHRETRDDEKEKVQAVREYILKSIDWNCEVKTLFREVNLGCGKAVSSAINWFFENEEMGIILEDDCLPSLSFFPYCKELLEKYKDNESVYHITGYNPLTETKTEFSYYFARVQHCWGWASWRRAWEKYSFYITDLDQFVKERKINKIFTRTIDKDYWIDIFRKMEQNKIDTWDYQWTYAIFNNNGICINPAKNLVTNIGFGADATNTVVVDSISTFTNQQRYEIGMIKHPKEIKINNYLLKRISKVAFGINWGQLIKKIKREIRIGIRKTIKNVLPFFIVESYNRKYKSHHPVTMNDLIQSFQEKSELLADNRFSCKYEDLFPCLNEKSTNTPFEPHYLYHPAWAARILAKTKPKQHIDIGSSLQFVAYISAFITIKAYDYRPAEINLSNLKTRFADIIKLPFTDNSIESLSSMHVVEHIGLERYGDPFDPKGDLKAINELQRVLKPGGNLFFVVPVGGDMRIEYNAHRIYTYESIIAYFSSCKLTSYALVTDSKQYLENADSKITAMQKYGCGCFWFTKR